jgi:calcium-dependent protein kinase
MRELCPESLLLDSKSKDAHIKIFDFGLAQILDPNHYLKSSLSLPFYDAPEVLNKKYDEACDVWSAGVILYVLLCGYPPFNGKSFQEISKNILKGKFSFAGGNWVSVSKEAKDLIMKMLVYNPKDRITAEKAIQHPWVQTQVHDEKVLLKPLAVDTLNQLKKFMVGQKLKQATMSIIVIQFLSETDKKAQQELFQAIDKNGDGKLSKDELYDGCIKAFGKKMTKEQIEAIFEKVDLDLSGSIDYNEFLLATINESKILSERNLKEAFNFMDKVCI